MGEKESLGYFRRIDVEETVRMGREDRKSVLENVYGEIRESVGCVVEKYEMSKKMEVLVEGVGNEVFRDVLRRVPVTVIYDSNGSFVIDKCLRRIQRERVEGVCGEGGEEEEFVVKVAEQLMEDFEKTLKTRTSNHSLRIVIELLTGKNSKKRYKVSDRFKLLYKEIYNRISKKGLKFFVENETRMVTYQTVLRCSKNSKRQEMVRRLVDRLDVDRDVLSSYRSFLYEEVCRQSSKANFAQLLKKVVGRVEEIGNDKTGNYFLQAFIDTLPDITEVYDTIYGNITKYSFNSNILYHLMLRLIKLNDTARVEEVLRVYKRDGDDYVKQLLFHNTNGSLNTKYVKIVIGLLATDVKDKRKIYIDVVSLFEREWLFNNEGRAVVRQILLSPVDYEIRDVFIKCLSKYEMQMEKTEEGKELLRVMERVGWRRKRRAEG